MLIVCLVGSIHADEHIRGCGDSIQRNCTSGEHTFKHTKIESLKQRQRLIADILTLVSSF